jgi:exodeoxyribonuclease VII small subunit
MSPAAKNQPEAQQEPDGYAAAVAELERLVAELDSQSVDVDVLSAKVSRASYLVDWCRRRIDAAEMAIEQLGVEAPGKG